MADRQTPENEGIGSVSYWAGALRRLFARRTSTPKDGAYWEKQAAAFLRSKGYRIISRNVRMRRGELDIVALRGDMTVFVEVKQRNTDEFGGGSYAIDFQKRHRLLSAAKEFLSREGLTQRPCRFDTIIIDTGKERPSFTHTENAFEDDSR